MDFIREGAILLVNSIALGGAARILAERDREVRDAFPPFFVRECHENIGEALEKGPAAAEVLMRPEFSACCLYRTQLREGGLYNALWTMGETLGCGMLIDAARITIRQETIELMELVGANPYYTDSRGAHLWVTTNAARAMWALEMEGIPVSLLGILTPPPARQIISGTKKEHIRSLDRPQPDSLTLAPPPHDGVQ